MLSVKSTISIIRDKNKDLVNLVLIIFYIEENKKSHEYISMTFYLRL